MRIPSIAAGLMVALGLPAPAMAQYYLSMELGGHYAPALTFVNTSTDRASICDEYINPLYASVPGCTDPNPGADDEWQVGFDAASGFSASLALGRHLIGPLSAELAYVYGHSRYDQATDEASGTGADADKLEQELFLARESVHGVTSHNLMLNVIWRLRELQAGAWAPYVGLGAGLSHVSTYYTSTWYRNPNVDAIQTGAGQPNVDEIRNNLAGTLSNASNDLYDQVFAWHAMVGMDYGVSDRVSLGLRLRRMDFGDFLSSDLIWDPLRSHVPNNRRDGSEPVHGNIGTSDLQAVSVGLVMRYQIN